jgi:hypothetical protein
MNPGDPGNPGRGPMWSLHIPTTGPLAGIRLLCASPQGGISPAPLRTDRRDQLCVPTPISWMKLLQRATTQVSSRNQFPSRNPKSCSLAVKAYMPSCLHKTSMKLQASLLITQDQPHPVYLNIRSWAQPSTEPCACKGTRLPIAGVRRARALARARRPRGLALPVRALVVH